MGRQGADRAKACGQGRWAPAKPDDGSGDGVGKEAVRMSLQVVEHLDGRCCACARERKMGMCGERIREINEQQQQSG